MTVKKYAQLKGYARWSTAHDLRRGYEGGASVRALADMSGLSYGTVRKLLLEARTALRSPGGNYGRARADTRRT